MTKRTGGCTCGAVRYEVNGETEILHNCHCTFCQRTSGSAFNTCCYFREEAIRILSGEMTTYTRINESGRKIDFHFCEVCGTTVVWEPEARPSMRGLAGGTFDDTSWIKNPWNIWCDSKQDWYQFPDESEKKDRQEIVRIMFLNKEKSLLFLPKLNTTPLHP